MAIEIWCELVCAHCAKAEHGAYSTGANVPRKALVKRATSAGWTFNGRSAFCGSECENAHTKEALDRLDMRLT
jgi:hypothetical protein